MKLKKPAWAKTSVPWEPSKIIWQRWALGETEVATVSYFEKNKAEFPKGPFHPDTIRSVREELLDIPVQLLDKLVEEVPELEPFIIEKRPDYLEERPTRYIPPSPHTTELCVTALAMAKNFEKIIREPAFSSEIPDCLGSTMFIDMAFTGLLNLEIIDEEKAADLFAHLKEEFSELKDIDSWKLLKISNITSSLVHRLELKAHEGKFKGRCPHCPK